MEATRGNKQARDGPGSPSPAGAQPRSSRSVPEYDSRYESPKTPPPARKKLQRAFVVATSAHLLTPRAGGPIATGGDRVETSDFRPRTPLSPPLDRDLASVTRTAMVLADASSTPWTRALPGRLLMERLSPRPVSSTWPASTCLLEEAASSQTEGVGASRGLPESPESPPNARTRRAEPRGGQHDGGALQPGSPRPHSAAAKKSGGSPYTQHLGPCGRHPHPLASTSSPGGAEQTAESPRRRRLAAPAAVGMLVGAEAAQGSIPEALGDS